MSETIFVVFQDSRNLPFKIPVFIPFQEKIVAMEILVDHWSTESTLITPGIKWVWSVLEPARVDKVCREFIPEWLSTWIGLKVNYDLSF